MKRHLMGIMLALCMAAAPAFAAPELSGVFADDVAMVSGEDGWYFEFTASEGGMLAMQLLSGETGEAVADVGAVSVEAGSGILASTVSLIELRL